MLFNKVVLVGRLVKDPELRQTNGGKNVCSMRLAVSRVGSEDVDYVPIVVWEKLGELCAKNLQKGRLVLVEGRLQVRQYERDGQRREIAEVVASAVRYLDRPKETAEAVQAEPSLEDLDLDNLPF